MESNLKPSLSHRIDAAIGNIFPGWGAGRVRARLELETNKFLVAQSPYRQSQYSRLSGSAPRSYGETGARALTGQHHKHLRNRAMNLDRNNILARSLLTAQADFAIGGGSSIAPKTGSKKADAKIESLWFEFWEEGFPEVRQLLTGGSIEHTLWRNVTRDGDCGVLLLESGEIQIITSDLIESPWGNRLIEIERHDGTKQVNVIIDGIELDEAGRHVAYHIKQYDVHGKPDYKRIERENFIFLTTNTDINNVRGEPCFAASADFFEHVDGYIEGVSTAARLSAMFVIVAHTKSGASPFGPSSHMGGGSTPTGGKKSPGQVDVEPGSFLTMPDTDDVKALKPEQPTQSFESFIKTMLLILARELHLPPEVALAVFENSYSASRGALVQAKRSQMHRYKDFKLRLLKRLYEWKVNQWIQQKKIVIDHQVEDVFYHQVIQYPHDYLNPIDDQEALQRGVEFGFITWDEAMLIKGKDPDQQRKEIAAINKKFDEMKIDFSRSMATRDRVPNPANAGGVHTEAPNENKADQTKRELPAA